MTEANTPVVVCGVDGSGMRRGRFASRRTSPVHAARAWRWWPPIR